MVIQFSSFTQSCPTLCDPMDCSTPGFHPSPTPGAYSNSCPSSQWCHPTISSSVVPFSSYPPSFPASGSFPMSQFFASGGQGVYNFYLWTELWKFIPQGLGLWKLLFFLLYTCMCVSCSVVSNSLRPQGLGLARLFSPWDSPGKNTGVGCHFLLQYTCIGFKN